nr:hypothetical protein [Cystobacter fuscus]
MGQVINRYAQVIGPVAPGDDVLLVEDANGFSAGELVMVLQVMGLAPEPSPGASKPRAVPQDAVGQWEFARVARVEEGSLTLTEPLEHPYANQVTQVIRVPEYTRVHVQNGASLRAVPWNGRTGGVIAFLATETLLNDGEISATGAGFRGGSHVPESFKTMSCMGMVVDTSPSAQKGEGAVVSQYGFTEMSREAMSTGGSGGFCPMAGGGGGGNGEDGIRGAGVVELGEDGLKWGGPGGTKIVYTMSTPLVFGGGGGAGGGYGVDWLVPRGGSGGGGLIVRARELIGAGLLSADGEKGEAASTGGAGGGGAGGSISLRFTGSAVCDVVSARGGAGGAAGTHFMGPGGVGGDGGSGRVALMADSHGKCPLLVDSGLMRNPPPPPVIHANQEAYQKMEGQLFPNHDEADACEARDNFGIDAPKDNIYIRADGTHALVVEGHAPKLSAGDVIRVKVFFGEEPGEFAAETDTNEHGYWTVTINRPPGKTGGEFKDNEYYVIYAKADKPSCRTEYVDFRVDLTPPDIVFNVKPILVSDSKSTVFEFSSTSGDVEKFECARGIADDATLDFDECYDPILSSCAAGYLRCGADRFTALEGFNVFKVKATDHVGNEKVSNAFIWEVDTSVQAVVFQRPSVDDDLFNTKRPFFFGRVEPVEAGVNVSISVDKEGGPSGVVSGVAVSDKFGYWFFFLPDKVELDQGHYKVVPRAVDRAKHSWPPDGVDESVEFVIDTEPPVTTIKGPPRSPELHKSRKSSFVFSTDEEEGDAVTFECQFVEGGVNGGLSFSCPRNVSFDKLANGKYTLSVLAKDKAGNGATDAVTYTWEVSIEPPLHPSITEPVDGSVVDTRTPMVSGTALAKGKVYISVDGVPVGNFVPVGEDSSWAFQLPFRLDPGTHSLRGQVVDENDTSSEFSPEIHFVVSTPLDEDVSQAIGGGLGCNGSGSAGFFSYFWGVMVLITLGRKYHS